MLVRCKSSFNKLLQPIALTISAWGISPSAITLTGVALTAANCLVFLATRSILPFCLAAVIIGLLDGLDGAVARASGRVTKFGGYLDALCDRYADSMVAVATAHVTGYWGLITLTLVGSLLISYAKARAAMEVAVSNLEWPDLMERTERGLLFLGGLALGHVAPWRPLGHDLFWWTLVGLAALIHGTVVQRALRARRFIRERERLEEQGGATTRR